MSDIASRGPTPPLAMTRRRRRRDGATIGAPAPLPAGTGRDRPALTRDPLVAALARYIEALDRRYPGGPDQLRREALTPEQGC
jgi:hypothetical protein